MTITTGWDNAEKTIVRYTFNDKWKWEQLYVAINAGRILQDTVYHRVDIILDMRNASIVPDNPISAFRQVAYTRHPNTGIRVMVGANSIVRLAFDAFARVYRKVAENYRFAATLDEAYNIIAHERAQLQVEEF